MRRPLLAILLLATAPAHAQPMPPPARPPPSPYVAPAAPYPAQVPAEPLRLQVGEMVRRKLVEKLVQRLQLDPATASKLAVLNERYDARLAPYRREMRRARRQLVIATRLGTGDDAFINRLLDAMMVNATSVKAIDDERARALRKMLAPRQFAQLVLALPFVKLEIQREIAQALRPPGDGPFAPGPGPGPGPGDDEDGDPDE